MNIEVPPEQVAFFSNLTYGVLIMVVPTEYAMLQTTCLVQTGAELILVNDAHFRLWYSRPTIYFSHRRWLPSTTKSQAERVYLESKKLRQYDSVEELFVMFAFFFDGFLLTRYMNSCVLMPHLIHRIFRLPLQY